MAFPLVEVYAALDPAHGVFLEAAGDDFIGGELVFDVKFEDGVEDFVRRKGVLVFLVEPKFGTGRFIEGVPWDNFPMPIDPAGDLIHAAFWQVGNDCQAAAHVAVNRAVADRELAFIAGSQ